MAGDSGLHSLGLLTEISWLQYFIVSPGIIRTESDTDREYPSGPFMLISTGTVIGLSLLSCEESTIAKPIRATPFSLDTTGVVT